MRILVVALDFKPLPGGIAEYTHQIARYLHLRGEKIVVLAKKMKGDREFDSRCSYEIERYDYDLSSNLVRRHWQSYQRIRTAVKKHSAEIVISNVLGSEAHLCWLVAKIARIPFVLFTYGLEIKTKAGLLWELKKKIAFRGAGKIFCLSSFTRNLVIKSGVPPEKTFIVPGGVSLKDFRRSRAKSRSEITARYNLKGKKVIFTLGRLVKRKGFDTVIKALPQIIKAIPNVVYLIGGEGPYGKELERLVEKYKLNDWVIFAGWVKEEEKKDYYEACDVFVMPCRELENGDVEGFGIVFLEANACGKPVIAGRSGGTSDAVEDNRTGLLVDPLDTNAVAEGILYLLNNPNIASWMGRNGRQRVVRKLSWEKIIPKVRMELRKIAEAGAG